MNMVVTLPEKMKPLLFKDKYPNTTRLSYIISKIPLVSIELNLLLLSFIL